MIWWYWLVLGLVLLGLELATPGGLLALFFGIGALLVGVLALLGIAGFGKIGAMVAEAGRGLGMNILAWGRDASMARAAKAGFEGTTDKAAFFARAARFTERKLVFDLNPRRYPVDVVVAELEEAGFGRVVLRPFFVPQTQRLPGRPAVALAKAAERTGPLARLALRARFTYLVTACR